MIDWSAPFAKGSSIIAYKVYIRMSDEINFALDLTNCDGSVAAITQAT